jgi:hypothetical protein
MTFAITNLRLRYPVVHELYEEHTVPSFRGELTQLGRVTITNTLIRAEGLTIRVEEITGPDPQQVRLTRSWSSWVVAEHAMGTGTLEFNQDVDVQRLARSMRKFCAGSV